MIWMPETDPFAIPATVEPSVVEPAAAESSAVESSAVESPAAETPPVAEPVDVTDDSVPDAPPAPPAVADDELLASVDVARAALLEITPASTIGEPAGHIVEGERMLSLLFRCTLLGYPDWFWTVSLARVDGEAPTVLETELMPGDGALLAPDWIPWSERLAEYQASQEAARAEEHAADDDQASGDDDDDDIDDVDGDDGDIDGVDIDALHERADDDSADDDSVDDDSDDEFESADITGVELATLELQDDESDDAESDAGAGGPEEPEVAGAAQWADEDDQRDEGDNP